MIYFDNSATGGFKPDCVKNRVVASLSSPVNVGRGTYDTAIKADEMVFKTRELLSKYVDNGHIGRVIFTHNCTEALNFTIFGTKVNGTEVVTTVTEHNSVLRPLYHLSKQKNLKIKFAKPNQNNIVDTNAILNLINKDTAFVIMNSVSNVTGGLNEFSEVGKALKGKVPFFVDGAQGGGHLNFNMRENYISALSLAGHKGLYSLQGVGVLAINSNFDLSPVLFGGSGGETFLSVPSSYPEKLEAGTINLPSIYSLYEGCNFAMNNMSYFNNRLLMLTNKLIDGLKLVSGIKIYSQPNIFGIVSFEIEGCPSMLACDVLSRVFGISLRGGFHCAPLMHKYLKTSDNGLIRASLSPFNTENEVDYFLNVIGDTKLLCLEP